MNRNDFGETYIELGYRDPSNMYKQGPAYIKAPYYLTGPLGSGKTTFALLQLFSEMNAEGKTVLVVQPSSPNLANFLHQWEGPMKRTFVTDRRFAKYVNLPLPSRTTPKSITSQTRIAVCLAKQVNEYLAEFGQFPRADWYIIDEAHLPTPDVMNLRMALRAGGHRRYILISSTPDGKPPVGKAPRGVVVHEVMASRDDLIYGEYFFNSSALNPLWYLRKNSLKNFCVVIILPTVMHLERVRSVTVEAGVSFWAISDLTSVAEYFKMQRSLTSGLHVVAVLPSYEAGIEINADVLIDSGYTYGTQLTDGVLTEIARPISDAEAVQRLARVGRLRNATAYVNVYSRTEPFEHSTVHAYLEANAIIFLVALGFPLDRYKAYAGYKQYARVRKMTRLAAQAAVRDSPTTPLIPSYKYDDNGVLFSACGGTAPGFADHCVADLRVYQYNGSAAAPVAGCFVAPIFDCIDTNFDPFKFVTEGEQQGVIEALVNAEATALQSLTVQEQLNVLFEDIDAFASSVFAAIRSVMRPGNTEPVSPYESTDHAYSTLDGRLIGLCGGPHSEFALFVQRLVSTPNFSVREKDVTVVPGGQRVDHVQTTARDALDRQNHRAERRVLEELVAARQDTVRRCKILFENASNDRNYYGWPNGTAIPGWADVQLVGSTDANTKHNVTACNAPSHAVLLQRTEDFIAVMDAYYQANPIADFLDYTGQQAADIIQTANAEPLLQSNANFSMALVLGNNMAGNRFDIMQQLKSDATALKKLIDDSEADRIRRRDAHESANRDLVAAQDDLRAHGAFNPRPPIMTGADRDTFSWKVAIVHTPPAPAPEQLLWISFDDKYLAGAGFDRTVDQVTASNDILHVLKPRIGLAALKKANPKRFTELPAHVHNSLIPQSHKWFWANNH